ncbi:MAG TPA: copper resistance protein B [Rhodanobacteraceae bacterium]|nr:copper resistance protein B [Rhodanobacteraceae bacterium]
MNTNTALNTKRLCAAAVAIGSLLALPAMAQDDMQGMQMSQPAKSSSAPAPASSTQSMQGMDMQGMDMSSMPGMQMPAHPAKPKKQKHKNATASAPAPASSAQSMQGMDMSSMQGMQMSQPAKSSSASAPSSSTQSMQGMDMQGMDMSSMPGMQMSSPAQSSSAPAPASSSSQSMQGMEMQGMDMSSMQGMQMPQQPSQPVELQHLDFGNMIGTRPKPGGLAASSHGMQMNAMGNMDMSSMQGGKAPPDARSPDYSDGYRYSDMPGMDMPDHAKEGMLLLDQFEYAHDNRGNNAVFLDGELWYGADLDKLWLKAEGESSRGRLEDLRTEALWNHAIGTYWGTQLGAREDFGEGPNRTWAAFGVQGLAPFWFDTEATLYLGQNGRTAARFQFEYEELITQRLVLQPKFEVNLYGKDDPQRGIGSGLSDTELGLRLRYELKREFAPYIGVVWRQRYGRTADLFRAQGERASDLQFVAGIHLWF